MALLQSIQTTQTQDIFNLVLSVITIVAGFFMKKQQTKITQLQDSHAQLKEVVDGHAETLSKK